LGVLVENLKLINLAKWVANNPATVKEETVRAIETVV